MKERQRKVALVTGAARRVGATIAKRLHEEGMNIALHYRSSRAEAERFRDELESQRADSVELIEAELLEKNAPKNVARAAAQRWERLDVVVNNASLFYPTHIGEVTEQQWDELLGINLRVPFFLVQAAARHLEESHGAVINIVDIYAERPLKAFPVYCIAKAGLVMMTKAMARELGPKVRVNGIAPGAILWPEEGTKEATQKKIISRTALKKQGAPNDIATAVIFLARQAEYMTGQILNIDGGRSITP